MKRKINEKNGRHYFLNFDFDFKEKLMNFDF